jgi:hypothetical protein
LVLAKATPLPYAYNIHIRVTNWRHFLSSIPIILLNKGLWPMFLHQLYFFMTYTTLTWSPWVNFWSQLETSHHQCWITISKT